MHRLTAAVLASGLVLSGGVALARPATYQCGEDREVKIDFTPRKAQLHLGDQDHTLQRIKSARDGHYVNRKAGYELIANRGELRLREGKSEVQCKLKITP
ncbi:MAG: MliC family protein [Burkholderiaceae bacterium]|jgi:hypothetical protein|nr:MliC family protein [Burkholderiaceae bacterium]